MRWLRAGMFLAHSRRCPSVCHGAVRSFSGARGAQLLRKFSKSFPYSRIEAGRPDAVESGHIAAADRIVIQPITNGSLKQFFSKTCVGSADPVEKSILNKNGPVTNGSCRNSRLSGQSFLGATVSKPLAGLFSNGEGDGHGFGLLCVQKTNTTSSAPKEKTGSRRSGNPVFENLVGTKRFELLTYAV